jgi:hypothetical protein
MVVAGAVVTVHEWQFLAICGLALLWWLARSHVRKWWRARQ